jgi:lipopolysaccharide export system permease protein
MKALDKYIFKEILPPFFGGLGVLTFMLLIDRIFDLMDLLVKKGLPLSTVGEVFILALPFIFAMTVPMAVLIAVLIAFGRLSQDFEILAMKSLGISLVRILKTPLIFSFIVFVGMCIFNNTILPESNHRFKNLMIDIYQKKPAAQIKKGVFTQLGNFLIYVKNKDERTSRIEDIMISEKLPDGRVRTIMAEEGIIRYLPGDILVLELKNGEIHEAEGERKEFYRRLTFEQHRVKIKLNSELKRKERAYRGDREMSAKMLYEAIKKEKEELAKLKNAGEPLKKFKRRRIYRLMVELHKKFALPFAAIVFVILGAPIAVRAGRGGYSTAFGIAFLVFTLYYTFLTGGEELADRGILNPVLAVWFSNFFFGLLGIYFLKKMR